MENIVFILNLNIMKKLLFLFIGIIFLLANIKAQTKPGFETMVDKYKVLDLADIKVTYRLLSMQDTVKKNVEEDIQVLLLGKNVSKYYSQKYLEYNINSTKLILKGADAIPGFREDGAFGYEIFKNMKDSEMEVTDLGACIGGHYIYKEATPNIDWKIGDEHCKILSYSCQKAIGYFRGRTYEVWFTTDIPVNNGPWKLGGLPGLILKASDSRNHYVFECIGLEQLKAKEEIRKYDVEYKEAKREEIDKLYKRYHKDYIAYNLLRGESTLFLNPVTQKWEKQTNAKKPLPYNPIELE